MAGRAERIFWGGLSSYGRMLLGLFIGLATTRAALAALSGEPATAKALFGVFALVLAVSTTSTLLNESVRQAVVRYLALVPPGDRAAIRQVLSTGAALALTSGIAASAVIVLAAPWLVSFFVVPPEVEAQAVACVRIFGVAHGLTALAIPWLAALRAREWFALENFLLVAQQATVLLLVLALGSLATHTLPGLALAYAGPPVAVAWILATVMALSDSAYRVRLELVSRETARGLLSLGGWWGLMGAATSLYERTDQILINLLLGPTFNAYYGVLVQLQTYVSSLVGAVSGVLLPTATRLTAGGSDWDRQQFLLRATRYALLIAIPVTSLVTVLRRPLVHAWLGPGFDAVADVLPLGMLLVLLRAPGAITWPYLAAADRLKWPTLVLLLDGVTNVGLSIFYVRALDLGLAGVLLGTISTSTLRFALFQAPYVARLTGLSAARYWREGVGPPVLSLALLAPVLFVIHRLDVGVAGASVLVALAGTAYAVGVWQWIFDPFERALAERVFARLRGVASR
jgi:O-antigen/teichoic acid export membrane protein